MSAQLDGDKVDAKYWSQELDFDLTFAPHIEEINFKKLTKNRITYFRLYIHAQYSLMCWFSQIGQLSLQKIFSLFIGYVEFSAFC